MLASALTSTGLAVASPQPASAAASTATVSTVYYWNNVLLELFRRQGGGPVPLARAAAIMNGGIFDTLNSANWSRQNLVGTGFDRAFALLVFDPNTDDNLAAGIAARELLKFTFPSQQAYIQQQYTARHGTASQQAATNAANQVINSVKAARANDGSNAPPTYTFDNVPGAWRLTPNPDCTAPIDPNLGRMKPFVMSSGSQFRRPLPAGATNYAQLLASSTYTTVFNEVKSLGRVNSTTRTATQTQIAHFWANDVNGTYKPPGQLLDHTRIVAQTRITNPLRLSRLYALLSFAMADAGIAARDSKFLTPVDLWRPVTAIQLASTDGNPNTAPDSTWLPLGPSPCFPAWISGHATFAGAWARVMIGEFGDAVTYTGTTEDPNAGGVTRTFTSFTAAATENARSRIYLGVHYQFDADDGRATGNDVGTLTNTRIRAMTCIPNPCY
ncbi:vanadium-dependent haloperoxidase [Asanoa sp. WMMD1127]|uniref:vanadium-dependent haloperoxidase n=1 Tax=Asanoa sp. WMMD1127 TaxID=3016107 RepID=UPI002416437D|nr:vanadium-dependent haloperoxidase [Asanoa sp. WMMD1127]MDG4823752.1 vanadium-dependent haloperoxidase [Asanoa sp. WMMD1127]